MTTTRETTAFTTLRRVLDEGFATGNADIVDELFSPDLIEHQFGMSGTGAEAIAHVKAAIRQVHETVPDMSYTVEDSAQSGDIIWMRVRVRRSSSPCSLTRS